MIDPTARGDDIAERMRAWYEAHRETWWDRHCGPGWPLGPGTDRSGRHADEFMLAFINEVHRVTKAIDDENRVKFGSIEREKLC